MAVEWKKDVDHALVDAKASGKPVLVDFSAAPACGACARLDAEIYPNDRIASFIHDQFIPVKIHIKEQPVVFHRFEANWTPTLLVLDSEGRERYRGFGYLPADEFLAQLHLALAQVAFAHKQWTDAENWYRAVVEQFPNTDPAPQAMYWAAVCRYKATNDHTALEEVAEEFQHRYRSSSWAKRSLPWLPKAEDLRKTA